MVRMLKLWAFRNPHKKRMLKCVCLFGNRTRTQACVRTYLRTYGRTYVRTYALAFECLGSAVPTRFYITDVSLVLRPKVEFKCVRTTQGGLTKPRGSRVHTHNSSGILSLIISGPVALAIKAYGFGHVWFSTTHGVTQTTYVRIENIDEHVRTSIR